MSIIQEAALKCLPNGLPEGRAPLNCLSNIISNIRAVSPEVIHTDNIILPEQVVVRDLGL